MKSGYWKKYRIEEKVGDERAGNEKMIGEKICLFELFEKRNGQDQQRSENKIGPQNYSDVLGNFKFDQIERDIVTNNDSKDCDKKTQENLDKKKEDDLNTLGMKKKYLQQENSTRKISQKKLKPQTPKHKSTFTSKVHKKGEGESQKKSKLKNEISSKKKVNLIVNYFEKKFRGTDGGTDDANQTRKVRISSFSSGEDNPVRGFVIGQIQMNSKTITNLSQHKNTRTVSSPKCTIKWQQISKMGQPMTRKDWSQVTRMRGAVGLSLELELVEFLFVNHD